MFAQKTRRSSSLEWLLALALALTGACNRDRDDSKVEPPMASEPAAAPEPAAVPAAAPAPTPSVAMPSPTPDPAASAAKDVLAIPTPGASASVTAKSPGAASATKQVVRGPSASDEPFEAWLEAESPLPANGKAQLRLVLHAKEPYKCNDSYPYKFKVAQSSGVTPLEAAVRGMEIGKKESTMQIPVTVGPAGKATLSGELSFSVCTEDKCLIEKQTLSISLDVQS